MHWTHTQTLLALWNVRTVRCLGMPGTFRRHCSVSCVDSDEKTRSPRWKIPLENPWKCPFRDSKFQNVPRLSRTWAFGASYKTAYYSLPACYLKAFWQPWLILSLKCLGRSPTTIKRSSKTRYQVTERMVKSANTYQGKILENIYEMTQTSLWK